MTALHMLFLHDVGDNGTAVTRAWVLTPGEAAEIGEQALALWGAPVTEALSDAAARDVLATATDPHVTYFTPEEPS